MSAQRIGEAGLESTDDEFVEFAHDPLTKITEYIRINADGSVTLRMMQDVDDILDATTRECVQSEKSTPYGEMARMASIPAAMFYDPNFGMKGGNPDAIKRFLNDRDYAKFRTRVGTV